MPLSETEQALFDALATVFEVFLAQGIELSVLATPLEFQRDTHRAAGRIDTSAVLGLLIDGIRDPERAQLRKNQRLFESAPPRGSA